MTFSEQRKPGKRGNPGPFLAEVVSNFDASYMGGLDVVVYKNNSPPSKIDKSFAITVKYLSPFYSVTSPRFEGNNSSDFNDVQKSHGMWMVPPDIGTKVLVVFVNGDINQGYWFGCVPDTFQNHMIPGIAASKVSQLTQEQFRRYGTYNLPVAEFLKKTLDLGVCRNPATISKAIHPFADRLLAQGLLLDTVRGTTTSSARRETPSRVFGISTPGPKDTSPGAKKGNIGYEQNQPAFVSRLGGSTFVMDDGDTDGQNELVRIRTRTGHQILLHNSHDLIYIANSRGTAWIELTSNGKIDIFAQDSVSIHTETDFNFRADRDINLEAKRDINIKSSGGFNLNVNKNYNLIVGEEGKLYFGGKFNHYSKNPIKLTSESEVEIYGRAILGTATTDINLVAERDNIFTANRNTNINSLGDHVETAKRIFMNGPTAKTGVKSTQAEQPLPLPTYSLPNVSTKAGWADGNFYKTVPINSIMQRVPTHEPWPQHENINSVLYSSTGTDAAVGVVSTKSANPPNPPLNPNQPVNWKEDKDFYYKSKSIAAQLGVSHEDFLAVIALETNYTFSPSVSNKGATGLIQFLPRTAIGLKTTTQELAKLTRTEQLDWVLKYFKGTKLVNISKPNIGDLYTAVIWPDAIGTSENTVIWTAGSLFYEENHLFDVGDGVKPKKGYITKGDFNRTVALFLPYVRQALKDIEANL